MAERVVVIGGGVAGMSAAHELVAAGGFDVEVYEYRPVPGGKARSMNAYDRPGMNHVPPGPGPIPGEHGFRFLCNYYRWLPKTMERIRFGGGTVAGNLRNTDELLLVQGGGQKDYVAPLQFSPSPLVWVRAMRFLNHLMHDFGVPRNDWQYLTDAMLAFRSASEDRRYHVYEAASWWDFCNAQHRSAAYKKLVAEGITRITVASGGADTSARTAGYGLQRLVDNIVTPFGPANRVLNAPTSDAWLEPWRTQLENLGVVFNFGARVDRVKSQGNVVTGIEGTRVAWTDGVPHPQGHFDDDGADHYILAVPVETLHQGTNQQQQLDNTIQLGPLRDLCPALKRLDKLHTSWMNGIQFYLHKDVRVAHGHAGFVDSGWALTLISQRQFWNQVDFTSFGDGGIRGILSVDISDWFRPDGVGQAAEKASGCTAGEIAQRVWAQLKDGLNEPGNEILSDANCCGWFLDPDIVTAGAGTVNCEPMFINTVGSWYDRPPAKLNEVANLYLAADYVQTTNDVACMESANEAARLAVRAIVSDSLGLHVTGGPQPPSFPPPPDQPPPPPPPAGEELPPEGDPFAWASRVDEARIREDEGAELITPFRIDGDEALANPDLMGEVNRLVNENATFENVYGIGALEQRYRIVEPEDSV
jgi:15-cis-phytoene desaturase